MKKTLIAVAAFASVLPSLASAQAAAPSPVTGNLTIVSDYRFRGVSQTYKLPAVQGGIDYSHASGFYLGNWNSSISGNQYPNGAGIEMDFYGGYKFPLGADLTLDVGALYYYYPGAFYNGFSGKPNYNNFELYVGGVFGPFSAKFFYAISDFFGLNETTGGKSSSGSYYIDLNYATEILPKLTLAAHLGYQSVSNYSNLTYTDYKIGVTYDYNSWLLGAAFIGTNAEKTPYTVFDGSGSSKFVAGNTVVFSVGKT
ncbi:MAG: TorF family putative porin, partial [Burkholderiaceae bacterium]